MIGNRKEKRRKGGMKERRKKGREGGNLKGMAESRGIAADYKDKSHQRKLCMQYH